TTPRTPSRAPATIASFTTSLRPLPPAGLLRRRLGLALVVERGQRHAAYSGLGPENAPTAHFPLACRTTVAVNRARAPPPVRVPRISAASPRVILWDSTDQSPKPLSLRARGQRSGSASYRPASSPAMIPSNCSRASRNGVSAAGGGRETGG